MTQPPPHKDDCLCPACTKWILEQSDKWVEEWLKRDRRGNGEEQSR